MGSIWTDPTSSRLRHGGRDGVRRREGREKGGVVWVWLKTIHWTQGEKKVEHTRVNGEWRLYAVNSCRNTDSPETDDVLCAFENERRCTSESD